MTTIVLNLLPFQLLVLLVAFRAPIADWARTAAAVLLASLIGWSSVFGWDVWRETIWKGRLFEFNARGNARQLLLRRSGHC